jgi:hypothetical protein
MRSKLKKDAELLKLLPEQSAGWRELEAYVNRRVSELVHGETMKRRDLSGMITGSVLVTVGGYLGYLTIQGGWWWALSPVAVSILFMGLASFFVSVGKTERDAKGHTIKKPREAAAPS